MKKKQDIHVVYKKVADLVPYARNSRTHSDYQVGQIAASIKEFGFTNPILIRGDNVIIAGHGRLYAAQKLEIPEVPCIVLDHLTDTQAKALVIADNKLALNSGWDNDMLKLELGELGDMDFNLDILGFDVDEINLINNGWDSDIGIPEHAYDEDGMAVLKIKVSKEAEQFAKETVTNALDNAGINYEL